MGKRKTDINLKDFFKELGADVEEAAKQALEEGAEIIVNDAKSRVAVDTGKLRDSIHFKKLNNGTKIRIIADAYKVGSDGKKIYYGQLVEFSPKINKPFMYNSLEAHRAEIKQNIINAIREAVHKNAKR